MSELREWIDNPATLDRICKQFNDRISERLSVIPNKIQELKKELAKVQKGINNFVHFISEGNASGTVATALKNAEEKKAAWKLKFSTCEDESPNGSL